MKKILHIVAVSLLLQSINAQSLEWVKYFGSGSTDRPLAIIADDAGNTYTTGVYDDKVDFDPGPDSVFYTAVSSGEAFVVKFDAAGNLQKAIAWGYGTGGHIVGGCALHTNSSGLYVGGFFTGGNIDFDPDTGVYKITATGGYNAYVLKLDTAGKFEWVKKWYYGIDGWEEGPAMTFDAASNIYSAGRFNGVTDFDPGDSVFTLPGKWHDGYISKLNSNGEFLWAKQFATDTVNTSFIHPRSVSLDAQGNVFITGVFDGTVDFNPDTAVEYFLTAAVQMGFVVKLNSSGNFQWAKRVGNDDFPLFEYDASNSIVADASGNSYITGGFMGTVDFGSFSLTSAGNSDIFIAKLDASANYLWAKQLGSFYDAEGGYRLTLGDDGNLYVSGVYQGEVDFNPSGGVHNLITNGSRDIFILKLTPNGDFEWAKGIGCPATGNEYITGMAIKGDAVYTTGRFWGIANFDPNGYQYVTATGNNSDVFIHKINQGVTNIAGIIDDSEFAIYPNPAANQFVIDLTNLKISELMVTLLDAQGKKMHEIALSETTVIDVKDLQRGLYFIKVQSKKGSVVKKLIVE